MNQMINITLGQAAAIYRFATQIENLKKERAAIKDTTYAAGGVVVPVPAATVRGIIDAKIKSNLDMLQILGVKIIADREVV